jgi:hypothetical protein
LTTKTEGVSEELLDDMIIVALKESSLKDAAAQVAAATGRKKRDVYQRALVLSSEASKVTD